MITAINLLSVIPMRKEPAHRSEMVSQMLFGEFAEILGEEGDFRKVKCLYDDYEGWVQANQLTETDKVLQTGDFIGIWSDDVIVNGQRVHAPLGSPVYSESGASTFNGSGVNYVLKEGSVWNNTAQEINAGSLERIYSLFLNTPYLWGGKSVFGIDCSGFVQQVFKMFGIKLLRDAYLQAEQGKVVENIDQARLGDLAFFQNEKGRITHVGMLLDNNKIVHASGKVRIDILDEKGIVNNETKKRTHQLHSMKRFF